MAKKFETERTRRFREEALAPEDERTIGHIEEHGCSVVSVERTAHGLGWSYTIGIFDTCGGPEIITVGLLPGTAHCQATRSIAIGPDGNIASLRAEVGIRRRNWCERVRVRQRRMEQIWKIQNRFAYAYCC